MAIDDLKTWNDFGGHVGRHCRECGDRHPGCHGKCEKYLEAKKEHDEFIKAVKKNKEDSDLLYIHRIASMQKDLKKRIT